MRLLAKIGLILNFSFLILNSSMAQPLKALQKFTHADTLRGTYGPSRDWWDVQRYDLNVKFNFKDSTISGYNRISFKVLKKGNSLQIDLQEPMIADSFKMHIPNCKVTGAEYDVDFVKDGNAYFLKLDQTIKDEPYSILTVYFHGKPIIAKRPPWDGGLIWKSSADGSPFVSVACQGLGASVWYPCKDHQSDEPDNGASIIMTYPDTLIGVANGKLIKETKKNGYKTSKWLVSSPINNYNIVPYIGKYVNFKEVYKGENGNLNMDYWVMRFGLFGIGNPGTGVIFLILSMIVYGMAFDFFNISGSLFVEKETDSKIRSSAQGLFMLMSNGLGSILGGELAGRVVSHYSNNGVTDWSSAWFIFAGYALVVAILFALVFKYKHNPNEIQNINH